MVREKRRIKPPKIQKAVRFDEDDPASYNDMSVPDKKSSQYTKDKIDEFHDQKITNLLARGVQMESDQDELDDEEEVMALDDSESEEDDDDDDEEEEEEEAEDDEEEGTDMESDMEGKKDDDLPDEMAWGNKKKMFYDSDYVTAKGKTQEEVDAEEEEEEEEAKKIQKRLAEHLCEEDYDLNLFQDLSAEKAEKKPAGKEERIVKDLKQMSQKEKMKLLKKESPELLELIADFKAKLTELKDDMQPLMQRIKDGRIAPGKVADYLKMKQHLYLNYCTNISFYLVLKAKRIPAHNHPVIERLLTYRNLINELRTVDARMAPLLSSLLSNDDGAVSGASAAQLEEEDSGGSQLEKEEDSDSDLEEEAALRFYREVEKRQQLKRKSKNLDGVVETQEGEQEEELDPDAKRGITYQMAKNKGLTPKRKKIDRNPRAKYREKFRRAKIRRKGQVGTHLMIQWHYEVMACKLGVGDDIRDSFGRSKRFGEKRRDTAGSSLVSVQASKRASNSSNPTATGAVEHIFVDALHSVEQITLQASQSGCSIYVYTEGVHTVNKLFKSICFHFDFLRQRGKAWQH
ncbi:something about silencing protein 10 isoform 2-T2 [Synchiropus picturatus]